MGVTVGVLGGNVGRITLVGEAVGTEAKVTGVAV
jgi:hypothetical protein